MNASSVCIVEGQWGRFTQSQWFSAPPGQNRKIPPKCRDRSGCSYCGPMYPREQELTPTKGLQIAPGKLQIQATGQKPAVENHLESEGNPVLHGEFMCLRR